MNEKIVKQMRRVLISSLFVLVFSSPLMLTSFASTSNVPACTVTITGENGSNNAIQMAIDNAESHVTGPVVCVDPGTYPEQLVITLSGITLRGLPTSGHPVLIQPTFVTTNSV